MLIEWFVSRQTGFEQVEFHARDRVSGARMMRVDLVMEPLADPGERFAVLEPAFAMRFEDAEALFQAMWTAGFRPPGERVTDQTLEAQRKHIVFAEGMAQQLVQVITGA